MTNEDDGDIFDIDFDALGISAEEGENVSRDRSLQIAVTFQLIAQKNNNMLGFVNIGVTASELEKAKAILILWRDSDINSDEEIEEFKKAVTMIEQEIKGAKL